MIAAKIIKPKSHKGRHKMLIILFSIFILVICIATRITYFGPLELRPDDILLGILVVITIIMQIKERINELPPAKPMAGLFLLLMVLCLSVFVNTISARSDYSLDGIVHEVARIAKYTLIFYIFWFAGKHIGIRKQLENAFLLSALAVVAIGFMQVFNLFGINRLTELYYKPEYSGKITISPEARLMGIQRIPSTFFNPNTLGLFFLIPLALSFARVLARKKIFDVILAVIFFAGIMVTQSRTAILCSINLLLAAILIERKRSVGMRRRNILIAFIIGLILLITANYLTSSLNLLRAKDVGIQTGSIKVRADILKVYAEQTINNAPLFGFSPIFTPQRALDNEYLYVLYFTGFVGLAAYLLFLYLLYSSIPKKSDTLNVAVSSVFLAYLFANTTMTTFYSEKLFSIFLMLMGLAISNDSIETIELQCKQIPVKAHKGV
ncbi:TPA: O-antigen ligase domain-containing protein [Candidatus Poribacteria bacterium]|nr:O-antigen ligase domain-containing protein [Candidatus Poribacteria bacterium]